MVENIEEKKYWVWFSLIKNIGVKRKQILLEKFLNPKKIYNLNKKQLLKVKGIGESLVNDILNIETKKEVEKHIEYMNINNIDIISINDNEYPQILKQIYDPPISIYVKGNKQILNNKNLAIIGCRDASNYGKKAAKYFAYNLAKEGYNIVSGLAKGIDSFAHIGNLSLLNEEKEKYIKCKKKELNNLGKTIAVIGSSLDEIYPKENLELANMIIENGGIILSEYPLGTKPYKMNFPARNRIISGLSKGIIVVEAKAKSGTLITVDCALEQGREVFALPSNINEINSVGTNNLIKQGAKCVTNYLDIINEM